MNKKEREEERAKVRNKRRNGKLIETRKENTA